MTRQRRVILDELAKVRTHPTADEVYRLTVKKLPKISLATIYRNLEFLSGIGLIQKIELSGSQMRYDGTIDSHYHVRCSECGVVDDLPGVLIENIEKKYQRYTSFRLTGCRIEFIGICPKCSKGKRNKRSGGAASSGGKNRNIDPSKFDRLYSKYNRREFVHPDPLEFLYRYDNPRDREIVALIASSLAYGKVAQILKSVSSVLEKMPSPYEFVINSKKAALRKTFHGFRHRFTSGDEIAGLLFGTRKILLRHGSLQACFMNGFDSGHETILPAMGNFVDELYSESGLEPCHLLPSPGLGSACKRLNLFLRWMIREDEVDPGGWYSVPPCKLIVPLDIHMHRIGLALGFTGRKQADIRTAIEITESFKSISPYDPVRYDFALTRLGIRDECDPSEIFGDDQRR